MEYRARVELVQARLRDHVLRGLLLDQLQLGPYLRVLRRLKDLTEHDQTLLVLPVIRQAVLNDALLELRKRLLRVASAVSTNDIFLERGEKLLLVLLNILEAVYQLLDIFVIPVCQNEPALVSEHLLQILLVK